jgi:hypothetical protein
MSDTATKKPVNLDRDLIEDDPFWAEDLEPSNSIGNVYGFQVAIASNGFLATAVDAGHKVFSFSPEDQSQLVESFRLWLDYYSKAQKCPQSNSF